MEITIFPKSRKTKDGRNLTATGIISPVLLEVMRDTYAVKFRDGAVPRDMPCNIIIERGEGSLSSRKFVDSVGVERESYTLWVYKWTPGLPYEDHSLDDFV